MRAAIDEVAVCAGMLAGYRGSLHLRPGKLRMNLTPSRWGFRATAYVSHNDFFEEKSQYPLANFVDMTCYA